MVMLTINIFFLLILTKNPRVPYSVFKNPKEVFENLAYEPDFENIETSEVPSVQQSKLTHSKTGFENPTFESDIPNIEKLDIDSDDDWVIIDDDKSGEEFKDDPSLSFEKISLNDEDEYKKVPSVDTQFASQLHDIEETKIPLKSEFKDEKLPKIEPIIDPTIPSGETMEIVPEPLLGFYNMDEDENETIYYADEPPMTPKKEFIEPETHVSTLKTTHEKSTYSPINDIFSDQKGYLLRFKAGIYKKTDVPINPAPKESEENLERLQREYGEKMKLTPQDEETLFVISRTINNKLAFLYLKNLIRDLRSYQELKKLSPDAAINILYLEAIYKYGKMDVKKGKLYYTLRALDLDCNSAKFYHDKKNCRRLHYIISELSIDSLIKIFDIVERK